mgnify:CR=1 FL=1
MDFECVTKKYVTKMGEVCTGVLQDFPVINLVNNDGNPEEYANEGKALQAFLFDSVEDSIIDKYIICNKTNTASKDARCIRNIRK